MGTGPRRADFILGPELLTKYYHVLPSSSTLHTGGHSNGFGAIFSGQLRSCPSETDRVLMAELPNTAFHVKPERFLQWLSSMPPCCRVECLEPTLSITWLSYKVNSLLANSLCKKCSDCDTSNRDKCSLRPWIEHFNTQIILPYIRAMP